MNRTSLLLLGLLPALLVAVPRLDVPAVGEGSFVRVVALDVPAGARIDLATGALTTRPAGDLEVGRGTGGALLLRPLEGALLSTTSHGPVRADDVSTWSLPSAAKEGTPSRFVLLRAGDSVTFRSERGAAGRLELEAPFSESGCRLKILTVPGTAAHVPRAPEEAPEVEKEGWTAQVSCPTLTRLPEGHTPVHVLEREQPFGSGRWERIAEHVGSGALVAPLGSPENGSLPVARLRVRRGLDGGALSEPGPARTVLTGGELTGPEIARAVAALADASYLRRVEGKGALELLGERARPALEAALRSSDPALAGAARACLDRLDAREDGPRARCARLAALVGDATGRGPAEVPAGLGDPDPAERAAGLLAAFEALGRVGARPWAEAVAVDDPHSGVRTLAAFLAAVGEHQAPSLPPARGPVWLVNPLDRGEAWPVPFAGDPVPGPSERAFEVVERPELADLEFGPALGRVLVALADGDLVPRGAEREEAAAELALELVRRAAAHERGARAALIGAVEALLPGDAVSLAALRIVGDRRRLADGGGPERERVVIPAADIDALRAELGRLRDRFAASSSAAERWAGVDLVLPPGTYGVPAGELATIDLDVSGLRLIASDPGVTLAAGVRARAARDVVLEGVTIDCRGGQALSILEGAHVVVVDSVLMGGARVVHVDGGALELHGSRLAPTAGQLGRGSTAQLLGGALLVARDSALSGGSLFIGHGGAEVRLDRCVLDSGDRPLAQGQRGGRLLARESFFLSRGAGFMAMDEIVLSAVAVDTAFQPFGRGDAEVRVGPVLFALTGSDAGGARVERLGVEPLPVALAPLGDGR
ncbi:MAG: hypothetical protein VX460_12650 [Planctomycetota bacterium]|nr:hypothetical protein [Planctomycetota bacterium]